MLYIILFSFLSGIMCALGFGGGTVLIIFLTSMLSYPQLKAQGINLVFFIPSAVFALINHCRKGIVDFSKVIPLALGGVAGIGGGYLLIDKIPTGYISRLFGGFVLFLGIKQLISTIKKGTSLKK